MSKVFNIEKYGSDIMEKYICKVATRNELLKRWEYLVSIHLGNDEWIKFREKTIRNYDDGSIIPYLGFFDGEIICEATAYIKKSAFVGDVSEPSGLLSESMAYLAAFRTNKEYEGMGYFSKLYNFMENDLRNRGYSELSVGVEQDEVRNKEIYSHLGFKEYIKTAIEHDSNNEEVVIEFYKKKILNI